MLSNLKPSRPTSPQDLLEARLLAKLDRLDLASSRIFAGKLQGERRSKRRGQSVEFDDHRHYTPGDDLRFIDWNVYARFERLFIKLFLEEEDLALHVCVDASASMETGEPSKLLFAARLATSLAYVGLMRNNRVGMTVFGTPVSDVIGAGSPRAIMRLPDLRGRRHIRRMAQFLRDSIWPESRTDIGGRAPQGSDFNTALTTIARQRVGKGVFVLVSDYLIPDGYETGLRSLAAAGGYDTFCIQVLSPGEMDPARETERGLRGDLRLMDMETGRAAEVTITPALLRRYRERLDDYTQSLHRYCTARGLTHLLATSDADLESFIIDTLRRTGVLR